jgi:GT2 family glycosyltransferase
VNEIYSQPLVSVIILNYNGMSLIERCLGSVLNSNYHNFEVLFVDNASSDNSVDFTKRKFENDTRLKIIQCRENFGFAQGNNIGVGQAKGKYLVFLNTDTEVNPDWMRELVAIMENDLTLGAAQSKLLRMNAPKIFDSAGDIMDYYGGAFSRGHGESDDGQYDVVSDIFSARGAAFIIKRDIFETLGMFDTKFVSFLEDVDLSWRIWLNGYRIVFVPKSIVFHLGGATLNKLPKSLVVRSAVHSRINQIVMMIKNYSFKNVVKYVPARIFINSTIVLSLFIADPVDAQKAFKYCRESLSLKDIWKEHLRVQNKIRKVPDDLVMQQMLNRTLSDIVRFLVNSHVYGQNFASRAYFYSHKKKRLI